MDAFVDAGLAAHAHCFPRLLITCMNLLSLFPQTFFLQPSLPLCHIFGRSHARAESLGKYPSCAKYTVLPSGACATRGLTIAYTASPAWPSYLTLHLPNHRHNFVKFVETPALYVCTHNGGVCVHKQIMSLCPHTRPRMCVHQGAPMPRYSYAPQTERHASCMYT
jgi:hypothetical protein